jgi:hypothetical protein
MEGFFMMRWMMYSVPALVATLAGSVVAAPVSWTGLGDGTNWSDPANWSGGVLPGPADDVTINVAANPTILIAGVSPTIQSLNSAEEIRINTGATLTTSTATSSAPFRIAGGVIQGGSWTFTGAGAFFIITTAEGRLNNPSISGDIIFLDSSARLRIGAATTFTAMRFRNFSQAASFEPGFVLNSQIIADVSSSNGNIELTGNGTFTIGPTGVIATAPGVSASLNIASGFWYSSTTALVVQGIISNAGGGTASVNPSTLSVAAGARLENLGTGTLNVGTRTAPNTWSSSGTIRATSGQINVQDGFTNNGLVEATGTGRVTLEDNWTNSGTLALSGSGRLDLGGTFTTASIGTITRGGGGTEGTLAVAGAWDNTGNTYTFSASAGSFLLSGGTITGGTINPGGGFGLRIGASNNTLNGINYTGEVRLDVSSSRFRMLPGTSIGGVRVTALGCGVSMPPGSTINFPIVIDSNAGIGTFGIDVNSAGTLTFGAGASITSVGNWTGTLSLGPAWWGSAATEFINQGTIVLSGTGRTLTLGGNRVTNNAGASVAVTSGTLTIDPANTDTNTWTSTGTITATDATVNFNDLWSVTGTVNVTNSIVALNGRFETPSLLRFTRSGGQMNIFGRLDNTGQTVTLNAASGAWRLVGGTIVGGSLGGSGANRLVPTGSGGTIDSVNLTSDLSLDESSSRLRLLGTTTATGIRLVGSSAGVSYASGMTINYPIVSDNPSSAIHGVDSITAGSTLTIGPAGSITTAPGSVSTLYVGEAWWGQTSATLTNNGLIASGANDRLLRIQPTSFVNNGTVRVRGGADALVSGLSGNVSGFDIADASSTLSLNGTYALSGTLTIAAGATVTTLGSWSNAGSIVINGGTLNLGGTFNLSNLGAFTNNGGNVSITGTLNNQSGLTLNATTGSWTLNGGTIVGGTVTQTQGARLLFATNAVNDLTDVQVLPELVVASQSARVRLRGTSRSPAYRITGSSAGIGFAPGYVLNETVTVQTAGSAGIETFEAGSLTIGPSGVVRVLSGQMNIGSFWFTATRDVTLQGTIETDGPSSNATVSSTSINFTNLDAATGTLTGGTMRALNGALISPGSNVRRANCTLVFDGNLTLPSAFNTLTDNLGTITLSGGRDAFVLSSQNDATTFTNSGRINLGPGSRFQIGSSGRVANFTQTDSGSTRFDLGGTNVTQHGSMRVFGDAALNGEIEADYVNGFQRVCGQVFEVIDANSRTGQFATSDLPPLTEETVFLLFYAGADVRLTVSARADFNQDGFLDFFDYAEFVECFEGNCPPGLSADFNGDGFVDFFDYLDYVFRFEAGCE